MDDDTASGTIKPSAELEEALPQRAHLCRGKIGAGSAEPKFLHEDVSSRCQQYTKLIRQETRATGPIDFEPMMQFFDSVFHVAAAAVDGVDAFGLERKVGNDVPVVIAGGTVRETDDLHSA